MKSVDPNSSVANRAFDHFLITTFNVDHGKAPSPGLDPDWLESRFDLFCHFCWPSVRSQTCQDFQWLVFFDAATPAAYRQRIDLLRTYANFVPVFVAERWGAGVIQAEVMRRRNPDRSFVITSRLDNDDAIAEDFIVQVQGRFDGQRSQYINFPNGYTLAENRLYALRHWSNPFASRVELCHGERPVGTVLEIEHTEIIRDPSVLQVRNPPLWLQVIHGRNISNRAAGIRVPLQELSQRFRVDLCVDPSLEPRWLRLADRIATGFTWGIRDTARTILKRKMGYSYDA